MCCRYQYYHQKWINLWKNHLDYNILYFLHWKKWKQDLFMIGLDNVVAVKNLLTLFTFFSWNIVLDIIEEHKTTGAFNIWLPILFQQLYSILTKWIGFQSSDLCQLKKISMEELLYCARGIPRLIINQLQLLNHS